MTDAQRKTYSERVRERLRTLLAERFGLVVHHESKDVAVFCLTVAKGGPKLTAVAPEDEARQGMRGNGRGHTQGYAITVERLAMYLGTILGRPVLDGTALTGEFDWTLDWAPDSPAPGEDSAATPPTGPSVFAAIQEQLGLKLEARKEPVDSIVIDRITHPTEND